MMLIHVPTPACARSLRSPRAERNAAPSAVDLPPPVRPSREVIDVAQAVGRLEGDMEIFEIALEAFLDTAPELLERMRAAAAGGDRADLKLAAHSLKGAAAGISAELVRAAAAALEGDAPEAPEAGLRGSVEEVAGFLDELRAAVAGVDFEALAGEASA
jgi:HPt (histidine-containing phosphotransfer) domain-containing protein